MHPTHVINENRWHALRGGLDCTLVDPTPGESEPARTRIGRLLLELEPYAAELGCERGARARVARCSIVNGAAASA